MSKPNLFKRRNKRMAYDRELIDQDVYTWCPRCGFVWNDG